VGRPDNFHYDPVTKTWDNNSSPGAGVFCDVGGWYWTSFIMGSLQRFGPVPSQEEARRRHQEDMDYTEDEDLEQAGKVP
jgi:hypothetical protein